ncbi:MAG: response regulator [Desulfobacula sp.]|nr:response regulator [Desulfobacula sp.]
MKSYPYFTTKSKDKGTGLGLAVAYGIVEEYNGKIVVDSIQGSGTSIYVYLPLIENSHETVSHIEPDRPKTGTERILLVDDEKQVIQIEKMMLQRNGYHVVEMDNSVDALAVFRSDPDAFDLVITDMAMPGLTGDQFARKLQEIRSGVPIILCSGFSISCALHMGNFSPKHEFSVTH